MTNGVGIEALAIAVPRRYIELADLARARGIEPEKYTVGLGCRRMAVADPGEDAVALDLDAEAAEARHALAGFHRQVATSLQLCAEVGNIYTGSLYLGLAGLLDQEAEELVGRRLGLFSYGSGNCSEFFSGTVGADAVQAIQAALIPEAMAQRQRIDVSEYESIMGLAADEPLAEEPLPGAYRLVEIRDHKRCYAPSAGIPQARMASLPAQQPCPGGSPAS